MQKALSRVHGVHVASLHSVSNCTWEKMSPSPPQPRYGVENAVDRYAMRRRRRSKSGWAIFLPSRERQKLLSHSHSDSQKMASYDAGILVEREVFDKDFCHTFGITSLSPK